MRVCPGVAMWAVASAWVALAAACGGDGFEFDGTPGQPVAATFADLTPSVQARVHGVDRAVLLDTGSPITQLDADVFPALADGKHDVDIETLGLTFPGYGIVAYDIFASDDERGGLVGGDLLRHFALSLDYRGNRAWLSERFGTPAPPADIQTGAETRLPFELRGGGASGLAGCTPCGTVKFPRTRITLRARFEGEADPVWVVVDTGSSLVLLADDLVAALGPSARPLLEGATVSTVYGDALATVTRVWRARLETAGAGAQQVAVDDVEAMVIAGSVLLPALSAEVGVPVKALIGGSFLRRHLTTVDYPALALHLAPYADLSHIPADEWIGLGFTVVRDGDDWVMDQVFTNRDAYAKGLRVGDVLEEVAGVPVHGQPGEVVDAALQRSTVGQTVSIGYRRLATLQTLDVLVEDLLPHYPPPS